MNVEIQRSHPIKVCARTWGQIVTLRSKIAAVAELPEVLARVPLKNLITGCLDIAVSIEARTEIDLDLNTEWSEESPDECQHEFDSSEGFHCLNCGKDGTEEVLSAAFDRAKDLRKGC